MPQPNESVMSLGELLRASNQVVGFQRGSLTGGVVQESQQEDVITDSRDQLWFSEPTRANVIIEPEEGETEDTGGVVEESVRNPWEEMGLEDWIRSQRRRVERAPEERRGRATGVASPSSLAPPTSPIPPIRPRSPRSTFSEYNSQLDIEQEDNEMRTVGSIMSREPEVSTVTPHPLILGTNRVGVEIEVERFTNRRARLRYWNLVSDGSLRNNGQEFTFRGALGGKDAFDAISEIDTLLYQSNPDLNIRCSTHVHVDVRDMTVPQLKKMLLAYAFYESFLFAQSGRHRMKSNFCMPLCIAEGLTHILMDCWSYNDSDFLFQATDRWDKYSAVNLIPIRSYGSVEFRIAEGKSKSGQLLRLVNRFLALKEVAMAHDDKDDRQFLDFLKDTDYRMVFRKGIRSQVVFTEEDFNTGWVIANDIATLGKMR